MPRADAPPTLAVTLRDLRAEDLSDLAWSGGSAHLAAVADALSASYREEVVLVVAELANGRLVALGGADLRPDADAGLLWMLSVLEPLQGLGLGTALVRILERRLAERGRRRAVLTVEHDNPRAAALYRRLGYVESGSRLESWPVGPRRHYVTVTTVLERRLAPPGGA